MSSGTRPTYAAIDLAALRANFALARELADGREVIAVIKADAYGHGAGEVARSLLGAGCRRLAVVTVDEAEALRDAGCRGPLLVLGGVHDAEEAARACALSLTPVLHDRASLALLREQARRGAGPLTVEVEIDTGMRRMGVPPDAAVGLLGEIAASAELLLAGVFTHLARADEVSPEASLEQLEHFRAIVEAVRERGIDPGTLHVENSAGLLHALVPGGQGDVLRRALPGTGAVRPGLMLYGADPFRDASVRRRLRPVMSLRSEVVAVRDVAAGQSVGYGGSHRVARATRIATLPIGYADGVLRSTADPASGSGFVWLAGARRPIVGRVSMDYITVDVGEAAVERGAVATLFGRHPPAVAGETFDDESAWRVEDAAAAAGTLAYELLVRVGHRVPRRFEGGERAGDPGVAGVD